MPRRQKESKNKTEVRFGKAVRSVLRVEQVFEKFSTRQDIEMNETAATMIGHMLVAPTFQEGLYTPERHLFYLAMETFIYQYRKSIGMLSAYAEPFYPPTEENQQKKDITKEASVQNNDEETTTNINNDKINQGTTHVSIKEKKSIQEANNIIDEDWMQVKRIAKTRVVRDAIQEAYIKNVKNRYATLKVDEEVVDEKDEKKKVSVLKNAEQEQRKTYNVNDITVEEMVNHINDYRMKDVIVKCPEETRKENKNSSASNTTCSKISVKTQEKVAENTIADSDSETDEDTDEDDSTTDDDDMISDDVNSFDSVTTKDLNEEEKLYLKKWKMLSEVIRTEKILQKGKWEI